MVERLYFTDSDEANALIATDPLALLIGFALDQQVTVQKAFSGPLVLLERAGTLDAGELSAIDLEPIFRERPAIHRFPGAMATRVHALVAHVSDATTATPRGSGPTRRAAPSSRRTSRRSPASGR